MAENKHDSSSGHDVHPPELENPEVRHETRDVNEWAIGKFGIALVLGCLCVFALLLGIFHFFIEETGGPPPTRAQQGLDIDARKLPPAPRLQVAPALDLRQMRAAEEQVLDSYAWIDRSSGTVRIPISRAIDLLAGRGLPAGEPK